MNKLKELYSSPTTTILVVRFEAGILQGSPQWSKSANTPGEIDDEDTNRTYGF